MITILNNQIFKDNCMVMYYIAFDGKVIADDDDIIIYYLVAI